jgi:hypothetical protein
MAADDEKGNVTRRDVLKGLSTVPALGLFAYAWDKQRDYQQARVAEAAAPANAPADLQVINIALLGAGAQGQVLTDSMLRIPGLRFRAVCDIWTEYNQKRVVNSLKRFKHEPNAYEDYREMLDKEKELDAVVSASVTAAAAARCRCSAPVPGSVSRGRGTATHAARRPRTGRPFRGSTM